MRPQAVSASLRYFSLGEVTTSGLGGAAAMTVNPYELSLDMGYSRKLSEKFSMGVVFRYIYSALGVPTSESESQMSGASAFAADIAGYYTTYPVIGRNECPTTCFSIPEGRPDIGPDLRMWPCHSRFGAAVWAREFCLGRG